MEQQQQQPKITITIPLTRYLDWITQRGLRDFAIVTKDEAKKVLEADPKLEWTMLRASAENDLVEVWYSKQTWLQSSQHRAELIEQQDQGREEHFKRQAQIVTNEAFKRNALEAFIKKFGGSETAAWDKIQLIWELNIRPSWLMEIVEKFKEQNLLK
jgi:hypothetical protein